jgi:hypothetical protein
MAPGFRIIPGFPGIKFGGVRGRPGHETTSAAIFRPIVARWDHAYFCMEPKYPMSHALTSARYSRPLVIAAAVAGVLCAGTLALWAHYGTAVFYEMILAGMAACL